MAPATVGLSLPERWGREGNGVGRSYLIPPGIARRPGRCYRRHYVIRRGSCRVRYKASVTKIERQTVDLSSYPDLVVIYLGMRVRTWRGLRTLFEFGRMIARAVVLYMKKGASVDNAAAEAVEDMRATRVCEPIPL